ncbi:signal recognition particle, SRP9/SRP14 subunit [Mycotypha africana]|uniref:signal recognition particle, SRP9/SRP14 subunit n=1 Tax=Mycotypha africana TaxID=64632 RepID=UPI00230067CF|nr:signal recognition particle, SRP9/SRP14 subunit [Mycotypha africana]KAI8977008.1 signal recognition particle, SRP9/SRP14 subunit [Mycotypha africana]
MYITNWDEFEKAAEEIYVASPERTRYVHTFHRSDGDLVLKVTDDIKNIKYKTDQMRDLKKFINLNTTLLLKMMNKEMPAHYQTSNTADEDTVITDAPPLAATATATKNSITENKTASPKQAPKKKKGKKRR